MAWYSSRPIPSFWFCTFIEVASGPIRPAPSSLLIQWSLSSMVIFLEEATHLIPWKEVTLSRVAAIYDKKNFLKTNTILVQTSGRMSYTVLFYVLYCLLSHTKNADVTVLVLTSCGYYM
jgi:hypothetical protein